MKTILALVLFAILAITGAHALFATAVPAAPAASTHEEVVVVFDDDLLQQGK